MSSFWISCVVPKFNDECHRKRCTGRRIEKVGAEMGAAGQGNPPEAGRSEEVFSPKAFRGTHDPANVFTLRLWPPQL